MDSKKYKNVQNPGWILLAVTFILLLGCVKKKEALDNRAGKDGKATHTIKLDEIDKDHPILYSDLFKSVEIVPLETTEEFLVSDISQVRCVDGKIFVFDGRQSAVFIFDRKGKALNKIDNKGQGPNEYVHIRAFDIDENEKLIYLYTYPLKIFKYDFDGTLIEKIDRTMDCNAFATNGKCFAMYGVYSAYDVDGQDRYCRLWVQNNRTGELTGYEEFDPGKTGDYHRIYNQDRNFYHYKDEVLFFYPFSSKIYSIKGEDVFVKYHMDFGERNLPADYFDRFSSPDEAYYNISETKYISGFYGYWENDAYWGILCSGGRFQLFLFFDKIKNQAKITFFEDDITLCNPKIAEATNEYMLSYLNTEQFFSFINIMHRVKKADILESNIHIKNLLDRVNDDSNPILFFYSFK